MGDLFSTAATPVEGRAAARAATTARAESDGAAALEVFEAQLLGQRRTDWRTLFQGYRRLKAITYSALPVPLRRAAAVARAAGHAGTLGDLNLVHPYGPA